MQRCGEWRSGRSGSARRGCGYPQPQTAFSTSITQDKKPNAALRISPIRVSENTTFCRQRRRPSTERNVVTVLELVKERYWPAGDERARGSSIIYCKEYCIGSYQCLPPIPTSSRFLLCEFFPPLNQMNQIKSFSIHDLDNFVFSLPLSFRHFLEECTPLLCLVCSFGYWLVFFLIFLFNYPPPPQLTDLL